MINQARSGLRLTLCTAAVLATFSAGCPQGVDDKADLDSLVNDVWLVDFETQNAIQYLEQGGTHYDDMPNSGTQVDAEVVLPLLVRLRDEFDAETTAVLETSEPWAWVLLIRLPADPVTRQQIESAVQEADDSFEGVIVTQWGYQWLAINVDDAAAELE